MYKKFDDGIIEVIAGGMFSGKSEELIKRIRSLGYANVKTLVIKPSVDKRWSDKSVITRSGSSIEAKKVNKPSDILELLKLNDYNAVAIDEAQFFDESLVNVVKDLSNRGIRVIVSGLDMDFEGNPFITMSKLMGIADIVDKQHAICMVCNKAASLSFRKNDIKDTLVLGDSETYEARCRGCFNKR